MAIFAIRKKDDTGKYFYATSKGDKDLYEFSIENIFDKSIVLITSDSIPQIKSRLEIGVTVEIVQIDQWDPAKIEIKSANDIYIVAMALSKYMNFVIDEDSGILLRPTTKEIFTGSSTAQDIISTGTKLVFKSISDAQLSLDKIISDLKLTPLFTSMNITSYQFVGYKVVLYSTIVNKATSTTIA